MRSTAEIRAITLTQPWASLIPLGAKHVETRSWKTSYRGQLLIHAGSTMPCPRGQRMELGEWSIERDTSGLLLRGPISWPYRLPQGAIVAIAQLTDCRLTEYLTPDPYGDYTPGRYGWSLGDVRRIPDPVSVKGSLGLWHPNVETLAAVYRQFGAQLR